MWYPHQIFHQRAIQLRFLTYIQKIFGKMLQTQRPESQEKSKAVFKGAR
jgi:hypothetical protein